VTSADQSLVSEIAGETLDWMGEDPGNRDDVADEMWAIALATVVDGVAITPLGYDVSGMLAGDPA